MSYFEEIPKEILDLILCYSGDVKSSLVSKRFLKSIRRSVRDNCWDNLKKIHLYPNIISLSDCFIESNSQMFELFSANIRELCLSGDRISPTDLMRMSNLTLLQILGCSATQKRIDILPSLCNLENLYIACGSGNSVNCSVINNLTNLTKLGTEYGEYLGIDFQRLTRLKNLRLNHSNHDNISSITFLSNLRELDFGNCGNDDLLLPLSGLDSLHLYNNRNITDRSIRTLTNLTNLNLYIMENVTSNSLKGLTKLTHLDVYIADIEISSLLDLPNLRSLTWDEYGDSSDTISRLTNLTSIVTPSKMKDRHLSLLTNLTEINLSKNTKITNDAIYNIVKLGVSKLDSSNNDRIKDYEGYLKEKGLI